MTDFSLFLFYLAVILCMKIDISIIVAIEGPNILEPTTLFTWIYTRITNIFSGIIY